MFQREMSTLLHGLESTKVIMDDILIYKKKKACEEHDARSKKTLDRILESGLKLNKDKCEVKKTQLENFGHIISQ